MVGDGVELGELPRVEDAACVLGETRGDQRGEAGAVSVAGYPQRRRRAGGHVALRW
jgi:hypothetical protein